jgi:hypothetical protein
MRLKLPWIDAGQRVGIVLVEITSLGDNKKIFSVCPEEASLAL